MAHRRQERALGAVGGLRRLLGLAQLGLEPVLLGHVSRGRVHPATLVRHRAPRQDAPRAVLVQVTVLELQHLLAGRHLALDLAQGRRAVVGVHEVDERPREHLLDAPAERARERGAQVLEVPVGARDAEHVERQREEVLALGFEGTVSVRVHAAKVPTPRTPG